MGSWPFAAHRKGVCSTTSGTLQRNFLSYFFMPLMNDLGRAQIWVVASCAALRWAHCLALLAAIHVNVFCYIPGTKWEFSQSLF